MSQAVESDYDKSITEISNKMHKIDQRLVIQTLYFERTLSNVEPQVELHIHYKLGSDLDRKKYELSKRCGFLIAGERNNGLRVGLMILGTIYAISQDSEIEEIPGSASCASY
jgi:hypothetical protein